MGESPEDTATLVTYLEKLLPLLKRQEHTQLIRAYLSDPTVAAMEQEYRRILLEVLQDED